MLNRRQRSAILELHAKKFTNRRIAKALQISRPTVKDVIDSNSCEVPVVLREEKAEPYRQQILDLHASCKGNKVRVHEELVASGAEISYPALTAFCRREQIGHKRAVPSGEYEFDPGEETQHDTSPFQHEIGGKRKKIQIAASALCFSRMLFFQCYPRFTRFECKVFLTEAGEYFDGSSAVTMIDNTHVVVLKGTGASMVPVPEMVAFAERYGFVFKAHEVGDANRSARVEGPFSHIQNNFFVGRTFRDWDDVNAQGRDWCDKVNGSYKRSLRTVPRELYVMEKSYLKPLPIWVPEVYRLHQRTVDGERYVSLHTNRYSVPTEWMFRQVEVRETKGQVEISLDKRRSVCHRRLPEPVGRKITLPQHRLPRGQGLKKRKGPGPEERAILEVLPEISDYLNTFKAKSRKQTTLALRQLRRMIREYPQEPLLAAVREAEHYGLFDLDRLERMVLRKIASDYFLLAEPGDDTDE